MKHSETPWIIAHKTDGTPVICYKSSSIIHTGIAIISNPIAADENAKRIIDCVNAMEGIEDPIKMRETWDIVKQLELDAYKKVREENDHLLSLLIDLMEAWCKGHSIAQNSAIAYNVGIALSKHDKLIFDGKQLSTAQYIYLFKDQTKPE